MKYDFSGWATRHNRLCSDGRVIKSGAFVEDDGKKVPLVWNHQHDTPDNVLGHAILENRDDGVYAYCTFNDSESGETAKELVKHGDISALSIYANKLKQKGKDVVHGVIREVSLVYAGANPDAYIENVLVHGETVDDEAIIYSGETFNYLEHEDKNNEEDSMANKKVEQKTVDVKAVMDTLTDEQRGAVEAVIGMVVENILDDEEDDDKDDEDQNGGIGMKHNVFETDVHEDDYLSHSDGVEIVAMAKNSAVGTLKNAIEKYASDNGMELTHGAVGGFNNVETLFPEYSEVRPGAPELITYNQGWVDAVLNKVHKSPISRIRTSSVDIRKIEEMRAKGYKKGSEKKNAGNFKLVRRTTDPQTVYVRSELHRDDIIDIQDFDYVQYLYNVDKVSLRQELARAILVGDGRDDSAEDKIKEDHIRPIWTDDSLYTIRKDLDVEKIKQELQGTGTATSFGNNFIIAEAMVDTVLHAREEYKGTGTPDMFISPAMLNTMLLARDMNGRRIYSTVAEIKSAFNVGEIYTVEQFANLTREDESDHANRKLIAIIVNMSDYAMGATKGGEITHFTDFDIKFNQQQSLLETRTSGANTRVYSAIVIEEKIG